MTTQRRCDYPYCDVTEDSVGWKQPWRWGHYRSGEYSYDLCEDHREVLDQAMGLKPLMPPEMQGTPEGSVRMGEFRW